MTIYDLMGYSLITIIVITAIVFGIQSLKIYSLNGKLIDLSPLEQLQHLGTTDNGTIESLTYSYVKNVLKYSVLYDKSMKLIHFVNFTQSDKAVISVLVKEILSVTLDGNNKVTLKTRILENPIITLRPMNLEDGEKLVSGLDIILKGQDL